MAWAIALMGLAPLFSAAGGDFEGGAKDRFGSSWFGRSANVVYARPTGRASRMEVRFELPVEPPDGARLWLEARDDELPADCQIEVTLNGSTLHRGPSGFGSTGWSVRGFPAVGLRRGSNRLSVRNLEPAGTVGMPPWFMVAQASFSVRPLAMEPLPATELAFDLPKAQRPFPEPLPSGKAPGFAIRGIKGWMWKPEQYFRVVPVLKASRMNFLMNCYTNMADIEHHRWGDPEANRWWEPIPADKKAWLERLARECREAGIEFCFSTNPNLNSKRILRYGNPEDLEALWAHYAWMQSVGVRWFNLSLDDISEGIDADGQVRLVNELLRRLRTTDPSANLIFCPTWYWGDGTEPEKRPYLETLARDLHPDVYLFWTGKEVLGPIRRADAESYRSVVRHRLFVWDNYPVNDANPAMHLGPAIGRSPDLGEVADGYMSNSMSQFGEANDLPMLTCADYAYNPAGYDPKRSIGQAILHVAKSPAEAKLLRELVLAYPGFLPVYRGEYNTSYNSVRAEFERLDRAARAAFVRRVQKLADDLRRVFPDRFLPERAQVESDLAWMRERLAPDTAAGSGPISFSPWEKVGMRVRSGRFRGPRPLTPSLSRRERETHG